MRRLTLYLAALTAVAFLSATSAGAATIAVILTGDTTTCGSNGGGTCSQNGSGLSDDWNSSHSASGGTSSNLTGAGSTSVSLDVVGAVAADDGSSADGNRQTFRTVNLTFNLQIDVGFATSWQVDVAQDVLGLFALKGDGGATAVGTQNNGFAGVSGFNLTVDGTPYNFNASPTNYQNNPSNNSQASSQFSGSRNDATILSGVGDSTVSGSIQFTMEAISVTGCSGFVCSSASGGEEAAVLFGQQSIIDQPVDEYSTWGRSIANDGYEAAFTLIVPEPTTLALLGTGLIGLLYGGRRR